MMYEIYSKNISAKTVGDKYRGTDVTRLTEYR